MKKINILLICLSFSFLLLGQERRLQNRPYADQKVFGLGFMVGLHTQDLLLTQSGLMSEEGEVWFSEIPRYSPGFSVGIIGDMYLNRYLNLRVVPTLHLGNKLFVFKEQASQSEFTTSLRNNYITIPLQLKIHADRVNNYRPYLIFGGYGSVELASIRNRPIRLKPYDYGIEIGVGCDFYLPFFKLSPELKFCFGLSEMLEKNREDLVDRQLMKYSQSLSKASQRLIVLSFNFE